MPLAPFTDTSKPGDLYQDGMGNIWRTIGWITHPAAILENVKTGERHTEVIGCRLANDFTRLVPESIPKEKANA